MRVRSYVSIFACSLMLAGSMLAGPAARAQQAEPDNTKTNKGDANAGAATADQQKMNPADRATTKKIRSALMDDKALSTYAHNIKIITRDGMVTLKGPVRTEEERTEIAAKAQEIAGATNVTNKLTVAPAKQ
jgi:hyperosmotically inducible periplasmic protein